MNPAELADLVQSMPPVPGQDFEDRAVEFFALLDK